MPVGVIDDYMKAIFKKDSKAVPPLSIDMRSALILDEQSKPSGRSRCSCTTALVAVLHLTRRRACCRIW